MKFSTRLAVLVLLGACLSSPIGLSGASAQAQDAPPAPRSERSEPRVVEPEERHGRSQRSSSLSDAVRRVQRETGGEVLGAERIQYDGREINRIKVLDRRGRVRSMDDDPQRVRGSERERQPPPPPARDGNP